jgi:D-arabinose 1-dehydrogenase-like Zn-dependent alcohol dehydrogenase
VENSKCTVQTSNAIDQFIDISTFIDERSNQYVRSSVNYESQVLNAYNEPYVFTDVSRPKLTSRFDLLIKVETALCCHTDVVCAGGSFEGPAYTPTWWPHIGCHEFAGTVAQVPVLESKSDSATPQFQIGDRAGVPVERSIHAEPALNANEKAQSMASSVTIIDIQSTALMQKILG